MSFGKSIILKENILFWHKMKFKVHIWPKGHLCNFFFLKFEGQKLV